LEEDRLRLIWEKGWGKFGEDLFKVIWDGEFVEGGGGLFVGDGGVRWVLWGLFLMMGKK
jgi:hypothetical protein